MSKKSAAPDLSSDDVVLHYTGLGATPMEVPARDLNAADLVRIHRIRALQASGGEPVDPASADDVEAVRADLLKSDAFRASPLPDGTEPQAPAEPAENA